MSVVPSVHLTPDELFLGVISESDVILANASNAVILGFNTHTDSNQSILINILILLCEIIY